MRRKTDPGPHDAIAADGARELDRSHHPRDVRLDVVRYGRTRTDDHVAFVSPGDWRSDIFGGTAGYRRLGGGAPADCSSAASPLADVERHDRRVVGERQRPADPTKTAQPACHCTAPSLVGARRSPQLLDVSPSGPASAATDQTARPVRWLKNAGFRQPAPGEINPDLSGTNWRRMPAAMPLTGSILPRHSPTACGSPGPASH